MIKKIRLKHFFVLGFFAVSTFLAYFNAPYFFKTVYNNQASVSSELVEEKIPEVVHLKIPKAIKAVYMTSCAAGTDSFRKHLIPLIESTELNSVVIDIKDYTGTISFYPTSPKLAEIEGIAVLAGKQGCRVKDMKEFIEELHKKGIYVIGRITVFQDPLYTSIYPEFAVKKRSDKSTWKDRKGLSFIDVGAKDFWDYIIALSKESYAIGFDELNYDYIRFPSDGNMKDIFFSYSSTTPKHKTLRNFFAYLDKELEEVAVVKSADLFGMTTTNKDDLNIGQVLEDAVPYFDYIAPMVYPSHYPKGFNGWQNVNSVPYEIVKFSLDSAVKRIENFASTTNQIFSVKNTADQNISTSTREILEMIEREDLGWVRNLTKKQRQRIDKLQLRPWLQDNDYPVTYTASMVRAQIQATYDSGLTSWMLWDPRNEYTRGALMDSIPINQ